MIYKLLLIGTAISNGSITLAPSDVTSVGSSLTNAGASIVQLIIQFAPYLIGLAVGVMVFNWISGLTKIHKPQH